MNKKSKRIIVPVVIGIIVLGAIFIMIQAKSAPGKLDTFAQCLKAKGAIFYGAFWCPHCQNQKAMFGNSAKLLPYFECSTPDGQSQIQACTDKNVTGYPTWVFADGSRLTGEIPLQQLADKTGCSLSGQQ